MSAANIQICSYYTMLQNNLIEAERMLDLVSTLTVRTFHLGLS